MKSLRLLGAMTLTLLLGATTTEAAVTWRVSVKVIVGSRGQWPGSPAITPDEIQAQFDFANTNPHLAGRGIVLEKTEVLEVTPPANASKDWFNVDLLAGSNKTDLEFEAKMNGAYQWRSDMINIYLNDGTDAGASSFPGSGEITVIGADKTRETPWVFIHEIGHFMSVRHTHQGQNCTDDDKEDCDDCPNPRGGNDDLIADTLPDHKCFSKDEIAQESFGKDFDELTATQQQEVDNTRFNIMSYHSDRSVFTTLQLDAMCDTSNTDRDIVSHNNFLFVDTLSLGNAATGLSKLQGIGGPFAQLKNAIDAAGGGDVLLLRPGNYTESREIRKAITLRAVKRDMLVSGNATIRAR